MNSLSFAALRAANLERCRHGFHHEIDSWSLSDWAVAVGGEVGEALNVVKKLNRERDGIVGNTRSAAELLGDLQDELADVVIYLDLTCARDDGERLGVLWDRTDFASIRQSTCEELPDGSLLSWSEWAAGLLDAAGNLASSALHSPMHGRGEVSAACDECLKAVDALARCFDIDLGKAVVRKFNMTSEKIGWPHVLEAA